MTHLLDRRTFVAAGVTLAATARTRAAADVGPDADWARARAIAARVRVPRFGRRRFDIRSYGAPPGGDRKSVV